jgi:Tol biopolymer transport system component
MRFPIIPAALVLAMLSLPLSAHASYPGANGNIAFVDDESDRGGEGFTDLRLLAPTGRVLRRAIQHCAFHEFEDRPDEKGCPGSPSFSRHGDRLAFPIDGRLAVAAADGTGRVLLPQLTDADIEPAWTRDGTLLFTGLKNGRRNVYIVAANGSGLRQLTRNGGRSPAYSERGLVAYTAGGYVRLVKPDGTGGRRLARGGNPDFSPSGKTVVYERRGRIYRVPLNKGGRRRLVVRRGVDPVFSPSGTRILYVGLSASGGRHLIVTVNLSGKQRRKLFDPRVVEAAEQEALFGPVWQPRR